MIGFGAIKRSLVQECVGHGRHRWPVLDHDHAVDCYVQIYRCRLADKRSPRRGSHDGRRASAEHASVRQLRHSDQEIWASRGALALGRSTHAACLPLLLSAVGSAREKATGAVIATRRVLVVEDEPTIREILMLVLEDDGLGVETARDGREALAKARRQLPDVVILDLMMATMSGWEFIEIWQADSATRHIPIVVVSAAYSATTAEALGVHAFLRKPFDIERLVTIVKTLGGDA